MTRLLALYPRAWRERYGAELQSLVDERPQHLVDRFDLLRGAVDAHRHPELVRDGAGQPEVPAQDVVVMRRLGMAGLVGAAAWLMAWFVVSLSPLVVEPDGSSYRDGEGALPILVLACGLLIAGLCGQLVMLPRSARVARAGAVIAIVGVLLWSLVPWNLAFAVTTISGLGLLAFGAWFALIWPTAASLALLAMVGAMPAVVLAALGIGPPGAQFTPILGLFIAVPVVAWLTVGGTLLQPVTERV